MNTLTLKPQAQPLYKIQPEKSHSRLSVRRVLYVKFLRWLDKSRMSTVGKAISRAMVCTIIFSASVAPSYILGFISAHIANKYVFGLCLVLLYLNYKNILRLVQRSKLRKGNQHTFNGVPVPELANFLLEQQSFPVEASIRKLHITQPQQRKIAQKLEGHGVLVRGESNARILRPISRVDLVKQLSENFPLEFSEHEQEWVKRRDTFSTYVLDREKEERNAEQKVEKRERKLHRINRKITELNENPFSIRELSTV